MASENYIKLRHLEEAIGFITNQNESLRKAISQSEFEFESLRMQIEAEQTKSIDLANELSQYATLNEKTKRLEFDIHKAIAERDFHSNQYLEVKKRLKTTRSNDFQIASLKKELQIKSTEVDQLKHKVEKAKSEIDNLFVFSERPQETKGAQIEEYYAKKMATLEEAIVKANDERKAMEGKAEATLRQSDPGHIRPEQLKDLIVENETLKVKVEEGRRENNDLRNELDRLQRSSADNANSEQIHQNIVFQQSLERIVKEIEAIKQDNLRLQRGSQAKKLGDFGNQDLLQKLTNLGVEKRVLNQKVEDLAHVLDQKMMQIESMKADTPDTDALQHLIDANKRMSTEIFRLQEQLRKIEQASKDSFHS